MRGKYKLLNRMAMVSGLEMIGYETGKEWSVRDFIHIQHAL